MFLSSLDKFRRVKFVSELIRNKFNLFLFLRYSLVSSKGFLELFFFKMKFGYYLFVLKNSYNRNKFFCRCSAVRVLWKYWFL